MLEALVATAKILKPFVPMAAVAVPEAKLVVTETTGVFAFGRLNGTYAVTLTEDVLL